MAYLSETLFAVASNRTVVEALLVHFDFEGDPTYLWDGFGRLVTNDGRVWEGTGELGSIEGLVASIGMVAQQSKFTLSGVSPDVIALAASEADKVKDRRVIVYLQFFDEETLQPLDNPVVFKTGILDQITFDLASDTQRSVSVTAEGNWTSRRRPAYSLYTDRDQNWRWPGDRGLEQVSDLTNKTIRWPIFP